MVCRVDLTPGCFRPVAPCGWSEVAGWFLGLDVERPLVDSFGLVNISEQRWYARPVLGVGVGVGGEMSRCCDMKAQR